MRATKFDNYWIQLEFDSQEEREKLSRAVSYEVPGAKFNAAFQAKKWDGRKSFLTAKNKLSAGLFKSIFPEHPLVYDASVKSISYEDIPFYASNPSYSRRDYQLKAVNAVFTHKRGIINYIMGAGKTVIAAACASYHLAQNSKNKILFVVYDKNILAKSVKDFTDFGFKVTQFGDNIKDLSGDIIVATIQSLSRIKEPRQSLKNITFVMADEAHHGKSKTSKDVLKRLPNCDYYIGLTATPFKEKTLELAELICVLGPIIAEYGFNEAVSDKKITSVKAIYLDLDPDLDVKEQVIMRKHYKTIWDTSIQNNLTRNNQIATILDSLAELLDTSHLVLVDRVEHGTQLMAPFNAKQNLRSVAMFGEDHIVLRELKKQKLESDNINTLVSSVVKEGVDFKQSPVVAFNASGRKSFISLIQFLGRITRPNPRFENFRLLIDMVDRYHPNLYNHSLERIKACKDFGVEVIVVKSIQELLVEAIKHYKSSQSNH